MQGVVRGLVHHPVRLVELLEVAVVGIARLGFWRQIPFAEAAGGVGRQLQVLVMFKLALIDHKLEQQVIELH